MEARDLQLFLIVSSRAGISMLNSRARLSSESVTRLWHSGSANAYHCLQIVRRFKSWRKNNEPICSKIDRKASGGSCSSDMSMSEAPVLSCCEVVVQREEPACSDARAPPPCFSCSRPHQAPELWHHISGNAFPDILLVIMAYNVFSVDPQATVDDQIEQEPGRRKKLWSARVRTGCLTCRLVKPSPITPVLWFPIVSRAF